VGALLCAPSDSAVMFGVIFFNNIGLSRGCGHGTIGLIGITGVARAHQTWESSDRDTVGIVTAELLESGDVVVANVPSYRARKSIPVDVPGIGVSAVTWPGRQLGFFWSRVIRWKCAYQPRNADELFEQDSAALSEQGIRETAEPRSIMSSCSHRPTPTEADSRNFVLCPGGSYEPIRLAGRGPVPSSHASLRTATAGASGVEAAGDSWEASFVIGRGPRGSDLSTDRGSAHVTLRGSLIIDEDDPFAWGVK